MILFFIFSVGLGAKRRVSDFSAHTGRRTAEKAFNSLAIAFSQFAGRVGMPKTV